MDGLSSGLVGANRTIESALDQTLRAQSRRITGTQFLSALRAVWHLDHSRSSYFMPFAPRHCNPHSRNSLFVVSRIEPANQIEQDEKENGMKDLLKRNTTIALALYLAVLGAAIEARADCQHVRGSDVETIIPSPNDPLGRTLGIVDGALAGASTAVVTSLTNNGLNATSSDVFVTNRGDMLTATGVVTLTPVPGSSSEFTEDATLTLTGGSGKYTGASGTITLKGRAVFDSSGGGTFDVIYQGSVCGPNLEADGN
jgi:hypothetical protein